MKNYILSALISLALISPWALADDAAPTSMEAASMDATTMDASMAGMEAEPTTEDSAAKDPREVMRARREEHRKAMLDLRDQLRSADDQAARDKIREQAMQLRDSFRQDMRKMMDDMSEMRPRRGDYPPSPRWNDYDDMRDGRFAPPAWNDDTPPAPRSSRCEKKQAFHDNVNAHLEKIESLLQQIVDQLDGNK